MKKLVNGVEVEMEAEEAAALQAEQEAWAPEAVSDPDEDLAQAIEASSTLEDLKAALLGTSPNARAAARARKA